MSRYGRGRLQCCADVIRTVFSLLIIVMACIICAVSFHHGYNLFFDSVPSAAQACILVLDVVLLAMLEGVQVSVVALKNHPLDTYRHTHPRAHAVSKLIHKQGLHLERFLMGRQILVVIGIFVAARMTTYKIDNFTHLYGMDIPVALQVVMQTGLLGVPIVAIFGQIAPQLVASAYPIEFMEAVPCLHTMCRCCLAFEQLGLVHSCYRVADQYIWFFGLRGPEESAPSDESPLDMAVISAAAETTEDTTEAEDQSLTNADSASNSRDSKLTRLCDVLDKIQATGNVEYDSPIFQLAMQRRPDLFQSFPSRARDGKLFKSPLQVLDQLQSNGYTGATPAFLLPPSDPHHVPPHVYASQLMAQNWALREALRASPDGVQAGTEQLVDDDLSKATASVINSGDVGMELPRTAAPVLA